VAVEEEAPVEQGPDLLDDEQLVVALERASKMAARFSALVDAAEENFRKEGQPTSEERANVRTLRDLATLHWGAFLEIMRKRRELQEGQQARPKVVANPATAQGR
jgi:hypothetical protein